MAANPSTATVPIRSGSEPQPLAVAPFSGWSYADAKAAIDGLKPTDYAARRDYANDEHWKGGGAPGAGFIGPMPVAGDVNLTAKRAQIEKQFAPFDVCGEGLSAIEDAFSTEAQVGAVPLEDSDGEPTAEQQALIDQALDILTILWDRVRIHEELKPAIRTSAWADRAGLRWWVPPGRALRGSDGSAYLPRAESLEDAAEWLALSRPLPDSAAIITDEATQERAAVYLDAETIGEQGINRAQIAYVGDDDKLRIRTVYENQTREDSEDTYDVGMLPMAEMRGDNLLTPSVIATQKALDYKKSTLTRIIEAGGFPERYITNAEPSGVWTKVTAGEVPTGPTKQFDGVTYQLSPSPRTLGASITTEVVGVMTELGDGKQGRATPTVTRFEPVDPTPYIDAVWADRAWILHMMRQGHRAMTSGAESSGFAYEQARAAFLKDLLNRKGAAEGMLRDLLTAGLGLIEALSGQRGYFTEKLRVTVDMHVDAGPRSSEERNQDRMDVEAGLLSPETAISRGGVEDVEAEQERIAMSNRLALLKEAATVFNEIAMASNAEAAVRALIATGVDPEIANALRPLDTDGGAVAP